jgi:hypothetical protein
VGRRLPPSATKARLGPCKPRKRCLKLRFRDPGTNLSHAPNPPMTLTSLTFAGELRRPHGTPPSPLGFIETAARWPRAAPSAACDAALTETIDSRSTRAHTTRRGIDAFNGRAGRGRVHRTAATCTVTMTGQPHSSAVDYRPADLSPFTVRKDRCRRRVRVLGRGSDPRNIGQPEAAAPYCDEARTPYGQHGWC